MSHRQTPFTALPNEIIYFIFDFLTNIDILRVFAQLNRRYADLVRFYIKRIDLTNGWQGNRDELLWIRETIQILKVDQYYVHLLQKLGNQNSVQRKEKFPLRSVLKNIFTRFKKTTTSSECCSHCTISKVDYQFPQLHSLQLINVDDWSDVISSLNLQNLTLWFDGSQRVYNDEEELIPHTIIRFYTNAVFKPNNFHTNLVKLSICVRTVVQMIEIIEHTPNLQHLHITFAIIFDESFCMTSSVYERFETMTANFHRLNNLNYLSIGTKHPIDTYSNEHLPFDVIQLFIDRCCPNKTILRKVTLQLEHIMFHKDMWLSIVEYKNTFDHFNFYASFIAKNETMMNIILMSVNDLFDYHIEDHFVHLYSLPFSCNRLHGFTSESELNSRTSFSSVNHLYFTRTHLNRPISFELLPRRMSNLISIDCHLSFNCLHTMIFEDTFVNENVVQDAYDRIVTNITVDQDIFKHVRFFRFILCCVDAMYVYRNLLPQLLDQMPHLECLITSNENFLHTHRPLLSIKRLDLSGCNFDSYNNLIQHVPNLSTLLLGIVSSDTRWFAKHLGSLFIGIRSLKLICFKISSVLDDEQNSIEYERIIQQILTHIRNMDKHFHHLQLDYRYMDAAFYLYNL